MQTSKVTVHGSQ